MGNQVGLCEVLGGLEEKITLIEKAHQINPKDTNILRALAYASFTKGDRKHGLAALILGLKIEPENKALIIFLDQVGYRRKRVINSLQRTNTLNQFFGRFLRKDKKSMDVVSALPIAA